MADSTYSVTITMSVETVNSLADSGSMLYAFKAVRCSDKGGLPLVWAVASRLMSSTVVSWTSPYDGYVAMSTVAAGQLILPGFQLPLPLGSTLDITNASGTGSVTPTGTAGMCSIQNSTTTQFSCGLSQTPTGAIQPAGGAAMLPPLCVFTLFGGNLVTITPLEQVLLMFSTRIVPTGTAVTSLNTLAARNMALAVTTGGVLIDMDGVTSRPIAYDRNLGWQFDGATWATNVPASADLRSWLILPDKS